MFNFIKVVRCPFCGSITNDTTFCPQCAIMLKNILNKEGHQTYFCDFYTAPYTYKSPVKEAVLGFKFENRRWMAKPFVNAITLCTVPEVDIILSIPKFNLEYYYNSSEVLAATLSTKTTIPYFKDAVRKIKKTKNQHCLSSEERLKNLKSCFKVNSKLVSGKNILIVDDIITTGRTVDEIAKECKACGGLHVYAVGIATSSI